MTHNVLYAGTGVWGSVSVAEFLKWAASPSVSGALAVVGTGAASAFTFYLARRSDAARNRIEIARIQRESEREDERERRQAEREADRERREDARRQEFLDAVNAARIRELNAEPKPPRPFAIRSADWPDDPHLFARIPADADAEPAARPELLVIDDDRDPG